MPSDFKNGNRALVIGAGVSGLLAARVLADRFREVVVLDRDKLPENPEHRKGVPQGQHTHGLLARGREALEELLPGLTADLVGQGGDLTDIGTTDLSAALRTSISRVTRRIRSLRAGPSAATARQAAP